ncbi:VOC family protein [uncultured Shewanella sp.]|uniref:VOC family protein n=1 Tax=uncultured Shewanella sp. TaxID=173975 RepID=UPI002603EEBA|nr:VOC family protein [uncultured Shewanella sp.]
MIEFQSISHINIVVDDITQACEFYQQVLEAIPVQYFAHFKNVGFAKSAGFMEEAEKVDVSIQFLKVPTVPAPLFIELMEYHYPNGNDRRPTGRTNDIGGVRHIALGVSNIDESFQYLKSINGVRMISDHLHYKPYTISPIKTDDFTFFDDVLEGDLKAKENVCRIISGIRYFYFQDRYGVQWELEQGHDDIASQ